MKIQTIKDESNKRSKLDVYANVIKAISHPFTEINVYKSTTFYDREENSSLENQCYNVCKLKTPNGYI